MQIKFQKLSLKPSSQSGVPKVPSGDMPMRKLSFTSITRPSTPRGPKPPAIRRLDRKRSGQRSMKSGMGK